MRYIFCLDILAYKTVVVHGGECFYGGTGGGVRNVKWPFLEKTGRGLGVGYLISEFIDGQ